jgi:4-amino-4-deoxy-L-arabinose transferase-like glycosyltransferase
VMIASAGWWVAIVELTPASLRPYIGGSQTNSFLELTFGYNGLGRLTGNETGSVGGGGAGGGAAGSGMWGSPGILRLFEGEIGGQISWLLPAALVVMVAALLMVGRRGRTDPQRAVLVIFGGWLVVTALAFSFMAGIFHAYYTVALAPPLAGTLAIGAGMLWSRRAELWVRIVLAATILITVFWAFSLLSEATAWLPWLKWLVLALGAIASVLLLLPTRGQMFAVATLAVALVGGLVAPTAYSLETIATAHTGSIVTAGPTVSGSTGGPGGGPDGGGQGTSGPAGGGPGSAGQAGGSQAGRPGGGAGGGMGGLLGGGVAPAQVSALLKINAVSYTWVAASVGSNNSAEYQLVTGFPVMAIGGFNGSDPSPTLLEFKSYVAAHKIHYFIGSGSVERSHNGSASSAAITAWVAANYTAITVDDVTMYDLTR